MDDPNWTFFSIDVEVSAVCDLTCAMCPREQLSRSQGKMSFDTFAKLADMVAPLHSRLTMCGVGNPMLNRSWPDFIRYYHRLGGQIGMLVHAAALTTENCEHLLAASPDFLEISFPSVVENVFAELCPNVSYQQCLRQVTDLEAASRRRFPMVMTSIETKLNPNEEEESKAFWGGRRLAIRTYRCHSRAQSLDRPDLVVAQSRPVTTCGLFSVQAFVDWEGNLLSCPHDLTGKTAIGNVNTDGVEELARRKAEILAGGMPFEICKHCDDVRADLPIPDGPSVGKGKARSQFLRKLKRQQSQLN